MARSGVCPTTTARNRNTFDDTPPVRDQKDVPIPDAAFATCAGGTNTDETVGPRPDGTTTTVEVCCPSPGPAGPAGPQGADGQGVPIGGTANQKLEKIDATDYNTQWVDVNEVPNGGTTGQVLAKATDTDYDLAWADSGIGNVVWRGYWQTGILYNDNDIVSHNNSSFVCNIEHTSSSGDEPDKNFDGDPGGFEWSLLSAGPTDSEGSLLDNVLDAGFDWVSDIENWGVWDYAGALVLGSGIVWAGTELNDMYDDDGAGDAESVYDGDATYSGASSPPTLQALVAKICDYASITNYDISQLPTTPVSLTLKTKVPARTILQQLAQVYFFDMIDTNGILKFIPRAGQTSVRSLTVLKDLGYTKDIDAPPAPITIKRYQGVDLPRTVQVQYISEANSYNAAIQDATLETFVDGQELKLNVPMTLSDAEAMEIAESLLINSHIERVTYGFSMSNEHSDLEPADIVNIDQLGDVRIIRIDEQGDDNILNFSAVDATFNLESHTFSNRPAQSPTTITDTPTVIGFSAGITVELPPLDATDVNQRFSIGVHGFGNSGWPGASVYVSSDGGVSYTNIGSVSTAATWGRVSTAIHAPTSHYVYDDTTVITVTLRDGTLSSLSKADVQNGQNWCLVGDEVIGFQTATLIAADTYELTGLMRGRRGTEYLMSDHTNDELFMLLNDALFEFEYPIDAKDLVYNFKFVTFGSSIDKATAYQAQGNMKSRRPWQPAQFEAVKNGNDYDITWIGRNQFNGEMIDSGPVVQPAGFRGYSLSILDITGSPIVLIRNIVTQGTNYTYTEAQQISDWGSAQATINVRINQLDEVAGPGTPLQKQFS